MPKQVTREELAVVVEVIRELGGQVSVGEISRRLAIPRRTLQRRLARLVEGGDVEAVSDRGGRRYRLPDPVSVPLDTVPLPEDERLGIALSPAAHEAWAVLRRPVMERAPVGYRRAFLDAYRPNLTPYLDEATRGTLHEHGTVADRLEPPGTYLRQVFHRLLIDLSWNSSRLEGNTYSLLDTQRLLDWGEAAEGKGALDAQMILNHKSAIELLVDDAEEIGLNRFTVQNLHALLSENLLGDPAASGQLRTRSVGIFGSVFEPLNDPRAVADTFSALLEKAESTHDPFEQAFFIMVHLPYLQPFEDVNKRVSRLAANIPLMRNNLCPLSFVDVPVTDYSRAMLSVYELNRVDYLRDVFVWAYARSAARYSAIRQSLGEPDPIRLRHRNLVRELVGEVVRKRMTQREASSWIAVRAGDLAADADRDRLVEIVETELLHLHEGSIARYHLRPAEYAAWQEIWT